ncbi:nickel pincer cofactor-dependent isomerase, group 22 [Candidatus Harpocratesius sp.]
MKNIELPSMLRIRQNFDQPSISKDLIPNVIHSEFQKLNLTNRVKQGESVAITAGSRGICHISLILKSIIQEFKQLGAEPFIFPAMGSHGGGTRKGQLQILANYGITEDIIGCPIKGTMDVDLIDCTSLGTPVYLDHYAAQADHIFIVNRIKPHTKFTATVESGLMKMCLIGMGKREGARIYHRAAEHFSWDDIAFAVYDVLLDKIPILGGLAILQNAYEEIGRLECLTPEQIPKQEPELLKLAYQWMARIPFPEIDLLVVDEMGKEFSGTGMDTNITGRKEGSSMKVHRLYIRDLTESTHGNAQGIGLADFTSQKLLKKIDFKSTYLNSQTAYRTDTCKVPMALNSDFEVLKIATQMSGRNDDISQFRLVWIKNTLELEELLVSEDYRSQIEQNSHLDIVEEGLHIIFDSEGTMQIKK